MSWHHYRILKRGSSTHKKFYCMEAWSHPDQISAYNGVANYFGNLNYYYQSASQAANNLPLEVYVVDMEENQYPKTIRFKSWSPVWSDWQETPKRIDEWIHGSGENTYGKADWGNTLGLKCHRLLRQNEGHKPDKRACVSCANGNYVPQRWSAVFIWNRVWKIDEIGFGAVACTKLDI